MSTFNAGAIEASLTLDRSSWNRELKELEAQFSELEQKTITVSIDADTDNAKVAMDNIELFLDDLDQQTYTPSVDLNIRPAEEKLAQLQSVLDGLSTQDFTITIDADIDNFLVGVNTVELTGEALSKDPIDVIVDMDSTDFHRGAAAVETVMDVMKNQGINIGVETTGVPKTLAELAELEVAIEIVDHNDVHVNVDYDENSLKRLVGDSAGAGGGGGYMGIWQILIFALIALSPILTVAVGAMTAAIVGFAAALVAAAVPLAILIGLIVYLIVQYKKALKAGDDLTPGMQALADQLKILSDTLHGIMDSKVGETMFQTMALGVAIAVQVLKALTPLLEPLANLFNDIAQSIHDFVRSPEFARWIQFFGGFGLDMLKVFLQIGGNLIRFLMNLFEAMRPFARHMMNALNEDVQHLVGWSEHLGQSKGFQEWIQNALYYGPMLLEFLGELFRTFAHIGDAIRPLAEPMIKGLLGIGGAIQAIPVPVLTQLIVAGAGLFALFKIIIPLVSTLVSVFGAATTAIEGTAAALGLAVGPFLLIVAAAIALGAILVYLWNTNKTFHDTIINTWDQIKKAVLPIISDIVAFIKQNWPAILRSTREVWGNIQGIIVDVVVILHQIIFFALTAITFIWQHFGKQILQIVKGNFQILAGIFRGFFIVVRGIFDLIRDVLTGKWSRIGHDLATIARGFWVAIQGIFRGAVNVLSGILGILGRILAGIWNRMWGNLKSQASTGWNNIKGVFTSLVGWLSGLGTRIDHAVSGMWGGIVSGFRAAINTVVGWWNSLSFSIPGFDPPGPGKFGGFTVHTPSLPYFAEGGWVDKPTLAVVGDGNEPEIVSPESKMADIVAKHSGSGKIDYSALASAIATAMQPFLGATLTPEMVEKILDKAGAHVKVDASNDDRSVSALARAIGFQLRVLGYGGATP